jgi:hypothetical protein
MCANDDSGFCEWNGPPEKPPPDGRRTVIGTGVPARQRCFAATIAEEAFEDLDAPVKRLAAPDTPVPFSPTLEKAFIPQVDDVVAGLRELAEY